MSLVISPGVLLAAAVVLAALVLLKRLDIVLEGGSLGSLRENVRSY